MIYVESHDRFVEVGDFDPETGELQLCERTSTGGELRALKGHFARVGGAYWVLYRWGASLWLRVGGESWCLDDLSAGWHSADRISTLILSGASADAVRLEYESSSQGRDEATALGDPEDWDFGLFVSNVLRDRDRRDRIYSGY